jgi:hypothetical protein
VPTICPSLFFIIPGKKTRPDGEHDIFRPDGFTVLQPETITRVKEINANTTETLGVRLLCCYRVKDCEKNYCTHRKAENPDKKICDETAGNKTEFIHFHITAENLRKPECLLAFIEGSELHDNVSRLTAELKRSIKWLEIPAGKVFLNIFTYGAPAFKTGNTSFLDDELNKNQLEAECDIAHINKDFENQLRISLKGKTLVFRAS